MLTVEKKRYTKEDYQLLEEGVPFQLIDGDLIMSPSPTSYHQILAGRIFQAVNSFIVTSGKKGLCLFAPLDVRLDEFNVFQPDLLYITEERIPELVKDGIEGAPDMVIEILSPATAYYDLRQKKDTYERFGVKEYIIVDPIQSNIELYFLEKAQFILKQKADKTGTVESVLLRGLTFDLAGIFSFVK